MINNDEFKAYQRALNIQRVNALKEKPLPKSKSLLEPHVDFSTNLSDLTLEDLPIQIPNPVIQKPVLNQQTSTENKSVSLF